MHQILFRLGVCSKPRWGAHSAPPDLLAGFGASYFYGKGRGGREGEERRREGERADASWLMGSDGRPCSKTQFCHKNVCKVQTYRLVMQQCKVINKTQTIYSARYVFYRPMLFY